MLGLYQLTLGVLEFFKVTDGPFGPPKCPPASGSRLYVSFELGRIESFLLYQRTFLMFPYLALQLFQSYLLGRRLAVVVDGCSSAPLKIGNSVYQGVVLGPFFWNLFFQDFSIPLKEAGFRKFCFADDGNAAKFFPCGTSFSEIFQSASECQSNYWRWGAEHRIVFDKKKEFLVVYSANAKDAFGEDHRNLGVKCDSQLKMDSYLQDIVKKSKWQLLQFRHCRGYFGVSTLMNLYKSYLLPLIEYGIPAYFHCGILKLQVLDHIQEKFLLMVGISPVDALLKFNLAPLCMRRLWAMLALLYKIATKTAPVLLNDLFELDFHPPIRSSSRSSKSRHRLCLLDPREKVSGKKDLAIFSKSIYGLVPVFNSIDSALIDLTFDDKHQPSVKKFQRALQNNFKQTVRDKGLVYAMDTNYHKF